MFLVDSTEMCTQAFQCELRLLHIQLFQMTFLFVTFIRLTDLLTFLHSYLNACIK